MIFFTENMIVLQRLTDSRGKEFQLLMELYVEAFPAEERRDMKQLERYLFTKPEMFFNAVKKNGVLVGLLIYWDLGSFYYLEHLAVFPEMRNQKIGSQLLNGLNIHLPGRWLLEVEPDTTEWARRRIQYYQRNGFQIIDKKYVQPPYKKGDSPFPLWIMGNGSEESKELLLEHLELLKNRVYGAV